MAQIQAHPWFLQNLPGGATDMNAVILAECATRRLQLSQPQEVIAALVRVSVGRLYSPAAICDSSTWTQVHSSL